MELRLYQQWFRHRILEALKAGHKNVLAVLPTGGGKRFSIVDLCLLAMQHHRRVLVITNRRLLADQMAKECAEHGVRYGVIMSDYERGSSYSPIQIASVQTLQSWFLKAGMGSKYGEGMPECDIIFVDEAHSDTGRSFEIRQFYPDKPLVGFTATPVGAEGKSLVPQPYSILVEGATNSELINQGHLLPTVVHAPSEPDIQGVKVSNRQEYNQNQLGRAVQECTVFADVYGEWQEKAADRATVVFVPGIPFGRDLTKQFNFILGAGSAYLIEAKTKPQERADAFQRILDGNARILVSCDVLREGFDLPLLSCGIDLQPNSQLRSYWQKVGRIKRPYGEQGEALWLDFAGNYWRFPHPDQDPEWPQGEETTQEAIERSRKDSKAQQPIMCPNCSRVRERGPVCPSCGHKAGELVRRIRMGNGKLKEIPAIAKAKREISEAEKMLTKWGSKLFGALKMGWTYGQCAKMFHKETGQYPADGWPGADAAVLGKSSKRVSGDLDGKRLYQAIQEAKRRML